MVRRVFGILAALAALHSVSIAQIVQPATQGGVVAGCAARGADPDTCLALMRAYIAALRAGGADAAALDQAVADLVVALASAVPAHRRDIVAAAIRQAAGFSSDAQQATRIEAIAATVASGDVEGTAAVREIAGSPA